MDNLYGQRACRAVGIQVMLNHCTSRPYLWRLIAEYGVKVILVTRRNVLKTFVSRCAAAVSGVYHVSASLPAKAAVADWVPPAVKIDSATVIHELNTIAQETDGWRNHVNQLERMELVYEEYIQDHSYWTDTVLSFLRVPKQALTSDLRKVNPDSLQRLIANYDEIADVVRRSPYAS